MATILHAADLHLGSSLRRLRLSYPDADWARPVNEAVMRLARSAVSLRTDLVLIAGDIADREGFDEAAAATLRGFLAVLRDAGIPVVSIDGNHDAAALRRGPLEEILSDGNGARHLAGNHPETVVFDDLGVAVHGRGVPTTVTLDDISASFPRPVPGMTNIGVLHTSLDGSRPGKPCAPVDPDALAAHGYDYWALGHVHQREIVRAAPWIVYPGNPQGRGSHEHGPKGAVVVETDEHGGIADVQHVETAPIRWATLPVVAEAGDGADDIAERTSAAIAATLPQLASDQRLAARVSVQGPPLDPDERRAAENAVREAAAPLCLVEGVTWAARGRGHSAPPRTRATIDVSGTASAGLRRRTTRE